MNPWLIGIVIFYLILLIIGYVAANYKLSKKVETAVNIVGMVSLFCGVISIIGYFVTTGFFF